MLVFVGGGFDGLLVLLLMLDQIGLILWVNDVVCDLLGDLVEGMQFFVVLDGLGCDICDWILDVVVGCSVGVVEVLYLKGDGFDWFVQVMLGWCDGFLVMVVLLDVSVMKMFEV